MNDDNREQHEDQHTQRTLSASKLVLIGFLVVAAYFLLTEHRAHVFAFLPYVFLAACPLMHIFMHGGHRHGRHHHKNEDRRDE